MSNAVWFPKNLVSHTSEFGKSVNDLPPRVRKAMLGAIEKFGIIKRSTWDGCAWNAACEVMGVVGVNSSREAAEVFETSPGQVSRFITHWDKLPGTDEYATDLLRKYLIEGFKAEAHEDIIVVVHESEETKLNKEFQSLVDSLDMDVDEKTSEQQEYAEDVAAVAGMFAPA